jgi:alpha-mannosidase
MAFNTPLLPVAALDELSTKSLPPERSFLSIDADNLVLSALKKGDRDRSIVVRLFEIRGAGAQGDLRFLGEKRSFRTANMLEEDQGRADEPTLLVRPYEIRTLRLRVPR